MCFVITVWTSVLNTFIFPANDCAGAAVGSFIGGVLLTAAIAGVVAGVIFFITKRKFTVKLE